MSRWMICVWMLMSILFTQSAFAQDRNFIQSLGLTDQETSWLQQAQTGRPIRIGYDPAWMPMEFIDGEGNHRGLAADLLATLGDKLGLRFEPVPGLTWDSSLKGSQEGRLDLLCAINRTPDREKHLLFTRSYLAYPAFVLAHDKAPLILDLHDLRGKRLAVVRGYAIVELLRQNYPDIELVEYSSIRQALEAVSLRRADYMIESLLSVVSELESGKFANVSIAAQTHYDFPVHMATSRKLPELRGILDKALAKLDPEETRSIQSKWIRVRLASESERQKNELLLDLRYRNRALASMFALSTLAKSAQNPEAFIQSALPVIASGFPVPTATSVRIHLDGRDYGRTNPESNSTSTTAPISNHRRIRGDLTVFLGPGANLTAAERELVDGAAKILSETISRMESTQRANRMLAVVAVSIAALGLGGWQLMRKSQAMRAQEAINRVHRDTERIIRSIPGVLFRARVSENGMPRLDYVSEAARELLGHEPAEIVLHQDKFFGNILSHISMATSSDDRSGYVDTEFHVELPQVGVRWVRSESVAYRLEDGSKAWIGVLTDITNRRAMEDALRVAMSEAQSATRAKADFLATMSHEIRTPMNAIINMSALALETNLDRKQHQYISTTHNAARGLLTLINDILDFSKIEAGKLCVEVTPFDLESLLEEITDTFRDRIQQKTVELIVIRDRAVSQWLEGDPTRLRQILLNLLSNSLKFTHHGEVVLRVEPFRNGVRFSVRDTGIGIPEEKLSDLFEPFTQVDSSTTRKYGGTGLGLSISRRLVALMGGDDLRVESQEGVGSEFWFILPLRTTGSEPTSPPTEKNRFPQQHGLIFSVHASTRDLLSEILFGDGLTLDCVSSEIQAVQCLEATSNYDFVLLDEQTQGMDGLAVARKLREISGRSDLPIILLSATTDPGRIEGLERLGRTRFVPKPIKASAVREAILELAGVETHGQNREPSWDAVRFNGCRILLAEDNEVNQFVARELLEAVGIELEIVPDGQQAVRRASEGVFDLVFMDVQMPVMDGVTATRALRTMGYAGKIVALTANAMREEVDLCLESGMDDFVPKPIDRQVLYATMGRYLTVRTMVDRQAVLPEIQAADYKLPDTVPGLDCALLRSRLQLADKELLRLLLRFRTGLPDLLMQLRSAVEAQDGAAVCLRAHSLAGAAGTYGAIRLENFARNLERAAKDQNTGEFASMLSLIEAEAEVLNSALEQLPRLELSRPIAANETLNEASNFGFREQIQVLCDALQSRQLNAIEASLDTLERLSPNNALQKNVAR